MMNRRESTSTTAALMEETMSEITATSEKPFLTDSGSETASNSKMSITTTPTTIPSEFDAACCSSSLTTESSATTMNTKDFGMYYYGWRCLRFQCLQKLNRPVWLLVCLCMCSVTQGMLINAFIPVAISTLERRFNLTSVQLGVFVACYDAALLVVQLPVCYYGEKGHKGRWLTGGMLLMAAGSLVCTIPHFISGIYAYDMNSTNLDVCVPGEPRILTMTESQESIALFILLCVGQLFHGMGAAPIYTLGITYLDENVARIWSPVYLSIFLGCSVLGPAVGYVLGGFLLRVYGDIGKVDLELIKITYEDMRWYGAWWVGFLVTCGFALVSSVLMSAFPRRLPNHDLMLDNGGGQSNSHGSNSTSGTVSAGSLTRRGGVGIITGAKTLYNCRTWMFLILVDCIEALASIGLVAFFPKVLENFFSISSSTASLLTGATIVPAAFIGNVVGGYVMKRFKLKVSGMLLFSFYVDIVALFLTMSFLAHCAKPSLAGITVPYGYTKEMEIPADFYDQANLSHACNTDCHCSKELFNPVCDKNRSVVYYSPCFAGCKTKDGNVFSGCTCIVDLYYNMTTPLGEDSLVMSSLPLPLITSEGFCPSECVMLPVFLTFFGLLVLTSFMGIIPIQEAELRAVPYDLRTFAFGLRWVFVRVAATIPGPVVFGLLVDDSCILWNGAKCAIYNNQRLSQFLVIGAISLKSMVLVCLYLARRVHLDSIRKPTTVTPTAAPLATDNTCDSQTL